MFFQLNKQHFFKPLNGKYRECVLQCLKALHCRLFTSMADYGNQLNRQQILSIFAETLQHVPLLDDDDEPESDTHKNDWETAKLVLSRLIEHAWIEQHFDEANMQSAYRFSKWGRLLTQALLDQDASQFRSKHRNTRNTKNALRAFANDGEIHDLLDAWEYSERIISDFSDLITELEDRKRELIQGVESELIKKKASQDFFDYMDKRFTPDVAVRLSADNIERHKDEIIELLRTIKNKRKTFKAEAELSLRKNFPQLLDERNDSILLKILYSIEARVKNASDTMIPEVRKSLQSYTNRADVIIRQLTYISSQRQESLNSLFKKLVDLPEQQQTRRLQAAGKHMETFAISFLDPQSIKLREVKKRRQLDNSLHLNQTIDKSARKESFIKDALEKAFLLSSEEQQRFLIKQLKAGQKVRIADLAAENAKDLLSLAHALELIVTNNSSTEFVFQIDWDYDLEKSVPDIYQAKTMIATEFYKKTDNYSLICLEKAPS